jgi:hypothetical protein
MVAAGTKTLKARPLPLGATRPFVNSTGRGLRESIQSIPDDDKPLLLQFEDRSACSHKDLRITDNIAAAFVAYWQGEGGEP